MPQLRSIGRVRTPARVIFAALLIVFLGAAATLLRFAFGGPFKLILPVQSPINAESIIGLSFALLVCVPKLKGGQAQTETRSFSARQAAGVVILASLPFLITLNAPLLHDSYAHVAEAASSTFTEAVRFFTRPSPNDFFFRPLGYLSYWVDFRWADYDPLRWHAWNLVIHAVNTWLIYLLATKLALNRFGAAVAALVFGIHGSRPEVVSWAAARFDLLAALFVLLCLIACNQYVETKRSGWFVVTLCCAVVGVLSKEAAYSIPLLAAGFIPFKNRSRTKDILRVSAALMAVCGTVFVYRLWVVGSVGGYRTATGQPAVLQFNVIHSAKGMLFRQWAFLFFPINWSTDVGMWVKGAVVLALAVMLGFICWSTASGYLLLAALSLEIIAALPVHHLLLMTADLAGARVLYLPVFGLALFWGLLAQGCTRRYIRNSLTVGLLLFQLAVLCHNLLIWRQVAFLSQRTCGAVGAELKHDPRPIIFRGLPAKWNGVFFLRNGFPQCVAINSGEPIDRVYIEHEGPPPPGPARVFFWNDRAERFQEVTADSSAK